jgi:hypothetical protein
MCLRLGMGGRDGRSENVILLCIGSRGEVCVVIRTKRGCEERV